jgi:hypothetical protein
MALKKHGGKIIESKQLNRQRINDKINERQPWAGVITIFTAVSYDSKLQL